MYFPASPVDGTIKPPEWKRPSTDARTGQVTQRFGPSSSPNPPLSWPGGEGIAAGYYADFHKGIDISCAIGNADLGRNIYAVAAGKVTAAGVDTAAGNAIRVRIDHGSGMLTWYYHLRDEVVSVGQLVKAGALIGHMGTTGWSTAVHLHLMARENGDLVDVWRRLLQNVTCNPKQDGINIRGTAGSGTTLGPIVAKTKGGRVIRVDGTDLGPTSQARAFGGHVSGASYAIEGVGGTLWGKVWLDGKWAYVAAPLLALSV